MEVIYNAHPRLVTDDLWERAQLDMPYHPRDAKWSSQARLGGLVRCSGCGRRLAAVGGGKGGRVGYYNCTAPGCTARVGIRIERLDGYVDTLLTQAFYDREPHIAAIMEGSDRYQTALEEVEIARIELETWVTEVKVSEVGKDMWTQGKDARQATLDVARKALRSIPAPKPSKDFPVNEFTFEEAEPGLAREFNSKFIDQIVIYPVGRGRRVPPSERAEIWLIGAEEALDRATVQPVSNPEIDAILAAAHTPEALKAAAAHSAAEVAATEAAYEVAHTEALRKWGGAAPVE